MAGHARDLDGLDVCAECVGNAIADSGSADGADTPTWLGRAADVCARAHLADATDERARSADLAQFIPTDLCARADKRATTHQRIAIGASVTDTSADNDECRANAGKQCADHAGNDEHTRSCRANHHGDISRWRHAECYSERVENGNERERIVGTCGWVGGCRRLGDARAVVRWRRVVDCWAGVDVGAEKA